MFDCINARFLDITSVTRISPLNDAVCMYMCACVREGEMLTFLCLYLPFRCQFIRYECDMSH